MNYKFFIGLFGILITLSASARDFEYTYKGQTLIYTVLSEEAKTVTTKVGYLSENNISGNLEIPSEVSDGECTYTVSEIGKESFLGCSDLTSVIIPCSVYSIDEYAFSECESLISVEISNTVTTIGSRAFSGCNSLTSVNIPNSVTYIGEYAFFSCNNLISIEIPNSITTISDGSFCWCHKLTSVIIPDSVTVIGDEAFDSCNNLTSIVIPASVNYIGKNAFFCCESLKNVEFASIESLCKIDFENEYSNPLKNAQGLYIDNQEVTNLIIPETVSKIGNYAFINCCGLNSVKFSNSVIYIGDYAFSGCI